MVRATIAGQAGRRAAGSGPGGRCLAVVAAALLGLLAVPAAAAPAALAASIDGPTTVTTGDSVTFTAKATLPLGATATYKWQVDGGATITGPDDEQTATISFPSARTYKVTVAVTYLDVGEVAVSDTPSLDVTAEDPAPPPPSNQDPVAAFTSDPGRSTGGGVEYTFTSTSKDPDGDELKCFWDFDLGDGSHYVAGPCERVTHVYARRPAPYIVGLLVRDGRGGRDTTSGTVVAGDAPPTVRLSVSPNPAAAGQGVTITAKASDPDDTELTYAWDVDGRHFSTPTIPRQVFTAPGTYPVRVVVRDPEGVTATDSATIFVTERPGGGFGSQPPVIDSPGPPPPTPPPHVRPGLIEPFPIVRIRGRVFRRATKFDVFSVLAPRGSRVRIRCSGRSCPRRWSSARMHRTRWRRFRALERRMRAGTVLQIFVTKNGRVGKYTRFRLRARKPPARRDLCVSAVVPLRVMRCPAG